MCPLAAHVLLQLVTFMTKQKSLRKIIEWINYFYGYRIARSEISYFSLLTKFNPKMQNFKLVLVLKNFFPKN